MNNKTLVPILIICGLIISGLTVRDGNLLVISIPFVVYLILGLFQAPGDVDLSAERVIDKTQIEPDDSAEMKIKIMNNGTSLRNLTLSDTPHPSIYIQEGTSAHIISITAEGSIELKYKFSAPRGVYEWDSVRASASDPFGLFERKLDIPAFGQISVHPKPMHISPISPRPKFTLHSPGPIPARLAGAGIDFWGVREYRPGDSLRHLNWRYAARSVGRSRKLFTNEYQKEEIADYGLILDSRKFSISSSLEENLFEYSVSAAAALAETFLDSGNRLSLLVLGEHILSVFPGYGKRQINRVQSALARANLGENYPFYYLEYLPIRLFPPRSLIVIFSLVNERDLEVYARLVSNGYEVILISPDIVDFAASNTEISKLGSLALRAARIEHIYLLRKLLQMGVKIVDWQVHQPLETVLYQVLQKNSHLRNF